MLGRKDRNPNQEIEEYRDLMQVPNEFEDGFTIKAILGVLFVAFIMVPGNMYLSLMIGGSLGAAVKLLQAGCLPVARPFVHDAPQMEELASTDP